MNAKVAAKLCLEETLDSVISISTERFVAQPINDKSHFVRNRLFLQGFPKKASGKELREAFSTFGKAIDSNIVKPHDNSYWCYGFVTFHPDHGIHSVDQILDAYFHGKEFKIRGRPLRISRAVFKPKKLCDVKPMQPTGSAAGYGRRSSLPLINDGSVLMAGNFSEGFKNGRPPAVRRNSSAEMYLPTNVSYGDYPPAPAPTAPATTQPAHVAYFVHNSMLDANSYGQQALAYNLESRFSTMSILPDTGNLHYNYIRENPYVYV